MSVFSPKFPILMGFGLQMKNQTLEEGRYFLQMYLSWEPSFLLK